MSVNLVPRVKALRTRLDVCKWLSCPGIKLESLEDFFFWFNFSYFHSISPFQFYKYLNVNRLTYGTRFGYPAKTAAPALLLKSCDFWKVAIEEDYYNG